MTANSNEVKCVFVQYESIVGLTVKLTWHEKWKPKFLRNSQNFRFSFFDFFLPFNQTAAPVWCSSLLLQSAAHGHFPRQLPPPATPACYSGPLSQPALPACYCPPFQAMTSTLQFPQVTSTHNSRPQFPHTIPTGNSCSMNPTLQLLGCSSKAATMESAEQVNNSIANPDS